MLHNRVLLTRLVSREQLLGCVDGVFAYLHDCHLSCSNALIQHRKAPAYAKMRAKAVRVLGCTGLPLLVNNHQSAKPEINVRKDCSSTIISRANLRQESV